MHSHPIPAFRDRPVPDAHLHSGLMTAPTNAKRSHLNGTIPILDLEGFMENDTDGVAFVVIRTVECTQASVLMARAGGSMRWTEAIYAKSKISKDALHEVATSYFGPSPEDPYSSITPASVHPDVVQDTPVFDRNRLIHAELFLFAHRHVLGSYGLKHPDSKRHVDALIQYANEKYGREFANAEELFASNAVTSDHVLKLFRPNDIVVSGTHGRPAAFVVQEWPRLAEEGWVTLTCWSFQPDGTGFARKRTVISIPPLEPKATKIPSLVAYPISFASSELRNLIRDRGFKHWDLRNATQVTYKGWNVGHDQFFCKSCSVNIDDRVSSC